ncbi:MAG: hypothetical protein RL011_791 [Pseudomonadota bacterium]
MLETADKELVTVADLAASTSEATEHKIAFRERFTTLSEKLGDIEELLEQLIGWTHDLVGTAEIVTAHERFHLENGKVFHDDPFYDARTTYFFDQFIFERKLGGHGTKSDAYSGLTPCQLFLSRAQQETPPLPIEVTEAIDSLSHFRHSIYQIHKISEKQMTLVDLIDSARISIQAKPREHFRGIEKRTIIQGFVFNLGSRHYLSSGIILHPLKANRLIKKHIKQKLKNGLNRKQVLPLLAILQLRYLRHKHVHPKLIYKNTEF